MTTGTFKVGDKVRVVRQHKYRGRVINALKLDLVGTVTTAWGAEPHRFEPDDPPHVIVDGSHWIEESCLEFDGIPTEEEVAEAIQSITHGAAVKHCPTCHCEEQYL
jgi:hypothetical protein